jgi:acetyl esterase/lipase
LSYDFTGESYTTNSSTDYVSLTTVREMIANLSPPSVAFADAIQNPQLSPGSAPVEHWVDIPVSKVLITVGEREVLYSSCLEFAEKLKQSCDSMKLVVGKGEWHDSAIVDSMFGIKQVEGSTGQAIAEWMSEMGSLDA